MGEPVLSLKIVEKKRKELKRRKEHKLSPTERAQLYIEGACNSVAMAWLGGSRKMRGAFELPFDMMVELISGAVRAAEDAVQWDSAWRDFAADLQEYAEAFAAKDMDRGLRVEPRIKSVVLALIGQPT